LSTLPTVGYRLADAKAGHLLADRPDRARHLDAGNKGERKIGDDAFAEKHLRVLDAGIGDIDGDVQRARNGGVQVNERQYFGMAKFGDYDCAHGRRLLF
jgi:hypothetical protein